MKTKHHAQKNTMKTEHHEQTRCRYIEKDHENVSPWTEKNVDTQKNTMKTEHHEQTIWQIVLKKNQWAQSNHNGHLQQRFSKIIYGIDRYH